MTSTLDVAWAAGLFEAEGCIYSQIATNGDRQRHVLVVSTDRDVLDRFASVVGGQVAARKVNGRYKPSFEWRMNHWKGQRSVLEALVPFFGQRRRAAVEAFLSTPPKFTRRHDVLVLPESSPKDHAHRVAWAAGVIEGEGCVANYQRGANSRSRWLTVTMTDEDVVDMLHAVFGVGVRYIVEFQNPAWSTQYEWRVNRWSDLLSTLQQVLPFLGERRAAAVRTLFETPAGAWSRPVQLHCKRGHPLRGPGADVLITKQGNLFCRPCRRARKAERRAADQSTGES